MTSVPVKPRTSALIALALVCMLGLWLRIPWINFSSPYIYEEDEGHHFNRVVEMVKKGSYNPEYFHKPSLHFYLRMPVVAISFLWGVKKGYIRKIEEIKTRDAFGLGGYAFTASHPFVLKWNRAFGVVLSLLTVILTFFLTLKLSNSNRASFIAATLCAVSFPFIDYSAQVGVDVIMTFFCVLAVYCAILLYDNFSLARLAVCGLVCGLAISSKYNAAPIALLPFFVCLLQKRLDPGSILVSLGLPIVGFILGSPYALISLPLFLNQFAYEIWHYGVEGHEGAMGEPGWPQAVFYFNWLRDEALGSTATIISLLGVIALLVSLKKRALSFLFFPGLFFLLMIEQKVNFTRNMVVIIPFCAACAGVGVKAIIEIARIKDGLRIASYIFAFMLTSGSPFVLSYTLKRAAENLTESRNDAKAWLSQNARADIETAIAGELQFEPQVYQAPSTVKLPKEKLDVFDLFLTGYDRLVLNPYTVNKLENRLFLSQESYFHGTQELGRIIENPEIAVYGFVTNEEFLNQIETLVRKNPKYQIQIDQANQNGNAAFKPKPPCEINAGEEYCWANYRSNFIKFSQPEKLALLANNTGMLKLSVELMSPWPGQEITFSGGKWSTSLAGSGTSPGKWRHVELLVPYSVIERDSGIQMDATEAHSPQVQGINSDPRRLSVALKNLCFADSKGSGC